MRANERHRRRGSMYVMVLGCAMVVTVIGLSALMTTRIERRFAEGTADFAQAQLYAQSAVEMGFHRIRNDPDWRTSYPSGVWMADEPIGTGAYTLEGIDPDDGVLSDSDTDPVVLTGIGVEGQSRYKLQVTLVASVPPLTCLEVALHANTDLIFNSSTVQCDQSISANNSVSASMSTIDADVEAVISITGGTYNGITTTGIAPRTVPDSTVLAYYVTNGTAITYGALPTGAGGSAVIENAILSPASNPYGATTNPDGVYVIDCAWLDITIQDFRIVGTLVLINPGPNSAVLNSINWEPAVTNYPALLVSGSMSLALSASSLSESTTATNFNPTGTPYKGIEDTDTLDIYPSLVKGLVYASNDLTTADYVAIEGVVVVGNTLTATDMGAATLELTYQQSFLDNPPPGFTETPRMVISPGSWRQVVD